LASPRLIAAWVTQRERIKAGETFMILAVFVDAVGSAKK